MVAEFRYAARASQSSRRRLFFATMLVIVLVVLDLMTGGKVRTGVRVAASSVWKAGSTVGTFFSESGYFSSRRSLEAQIQALQQALAQAQQQNAAFSIVQSQNQELSQITHLVQKDPGVTAPIISSLQSSPYGTFLIGAGSEDGIAAHSLILTPGGFVVGTIVDLQSHSSLVQESFAPGQMLDIVVDGASVTASGQGGGVFSAQVPRGIPVSVGDPVVAPSLGGRPVGVVQHVDSNPANAQANILIALPVSFSSLQFVYVTP